MLKRTHMIVAGLALFLVSISMAQDTATAQPRISTELTGKIDRLSGEVTIKSGLRDREFTNFNQVKPMLETEKGYTRTGVEKLKTLLTNSYQTGDDLKTARPTSEDALVEIEFDDDGSTVKFKVLAADLSGFASYEQIFAKAAPKQCVWVGSCKVCDGKPKCIVRGLFKSGFRNAITR